MKYLIAGLGNIGFEYENTRHNVGFKILDFIADQEHLIFSGKRLGHITEWKYKGRTLILLKPNTYMNLSGNAINYWLQSENIPLSNLLVVTDDISLPFGKIRLRGKGSAGGHNGLKNISELLNTENYARLRVGVGNSFSKGKQVDYVLGNWGSEEQVALLPILKQCADTIASFTFCGLALTMNQFNAK